MTLNPGPMDAFGVKWTYSPALGMYRGPRGLHFNPKDGTIIRVRKAGQWEPVDVVDGKIVIRDGPDLEWYRVQLSEPARDKIRSISESWPGRATNRAAVILAIDENGPALSDEDAAVKFELAPATIGKIRRAFVKRGIQVLERTAK